jgi:hypothetical protein
MVPRVSAAAGDCCYNDSRSLFVAGVLAKKQPTQKGLTGERVR